MRILLLQSSSYIPSLGGANKANRLLLEQLAARGHECRAIGTAGTAGGDGATAFRHAGVEVEAVLDGTRLRAYAARRLRELAPDRVLVSSEDPGQVLLEEAVEASPHVVYLAHTTLHLSFGPDGFLQSPGRTALLRRAAGIVAVSGYVRDYIRRWAGLGSTLLRFPVYGKGPFPAPGDFDRGFVTLINPCAVKGISIFLELARRLPDVAFAAVPTWGTTAGDREALEALPNVRILPPAADVDEIFARTRVLLAPSLWGEAFGQVAVEAMLRGIPVLASDAGGLPEAKLGVDYVLPVRPIRSYEERFDERKIPVAVVPEQDAGPWEETLRRVLGDRSLYARLSWESRRAAHGFVAGLGTAPFEEYLDGLLDGGRRKRMRILLVQPLDYLFSPGGAHKANRLLLQGLTARGHVCRVVAPGRAGNESTVFDHEGVEVHAVAGGLELRAEATRQVRALAPDWTIVSEDPSGEILQTVLEVSPSRVVYLAHSPATLPFGPAAFAADEAQTALLRRTAGILTVSRAMQDYIRRWGGLAATVVYSPAYGAGPFKAPVAPERGFVTMINPSGIKGVSIFAGLARRMPGVAFAAVPTWSTTAEDREILAGLPNVTLLPAAEDVDELYARVRILVVPSLWGEAFGQVVIEALLRGIPVVTSDQGGLPEAGLGVTRIVPVRPIERYENRLDDRRMPVPVVPEQDLEPWEAELRALLSDPGAYARLAEASRRAAALFVSGLGIEPYERFLADLAPAPAAAQPAGTSTAVAPSGADLRRQKLAGLSPEKLELLARRLKKKEGAADATAAGTIPRLARRGRPDGGDRFPLSFAQRRLWFLDRFEPGRLTYNEYFAVHLSGPLAARLLADALDRIVRRHEVLRTTYAQDAEEPVQIVHAPRPDDRLALPVADLGALPEAARQAEAARLATAETRRPFDLAEGPVLRALLLGLGSGEHLLVITAHHIAVDNWSATVLFAELAALYGSSDLGALPELAVQYADFAAWQRDWLSGPALAEQIDFWRRQLAGAPGLADLPTDRPRPALQSFRGNRLVTYFPPPLAERLRALARRRDATPYMLLLAAWQTLLHRITGQDDLVVGTPVAGRIRPEIEPLIGCFLNILPMRARLAPGLPFEEALDRARQTALDAFAHQELPFERLVEALAPERSLSHSPLFQVLFNFLNVPPRIEELRGGVRLDAIPVQSGTTRFDLELYLEEQEQRLVVALVYSTDLFDTATMTRLLGHLETLLAGVAAEPDRTLSELPLLTAAEHHQLLREWNGMASPAPGGATIPTIPALFAAQVARSPEATAVAGAGETLTYRELAARAHRLADRLRALGIGPEATVGVCLRRSPDLVAAVLGVLEAGAAYVPLDPAYPAERLAFMLADSGAAVVLADAASRPRLPASLPATMAAVLHVDAIEAEAGTPPAGRGPARRPAGPGNLAYVIYTSGSTGRPKGVAIEHASAAAFVQWSGQIFGAELGGRHGGVLASTSICFDLSVFEIFATLCHGGFLVLVENALELADRPPAAEIGLINTVPSALAELLRRGAVPRSVRTVNLAGEPLPGVLARQIYEETAAQRVFNLYGPSEDTTYSLFARVDRGDEQPAIGRPVAGTRACVAGPGGALLPAGIPGELLLGGAGLARGYLGRPGLTAELFVPDPWGTEPGARLYRTGDLVRSRGDGRMEFLGRIDQQVKIRGFRVEPGEIEEALRQHPRVREAAVVSREVTGARALVAYVVARADQPTPQELREHLRERLPEHMVPAFFIPLAELPLTPNGKVDRRALPDPEREAAPAEHAPRSPAEELLAGIWAEVLGLERVGIHQNFFALGGHSLLATRVISRLRDLFGVELPLRTLFERPTVAELCAAVEKARDSGTDKAAPPLVPVPREGSLPLSFAQERLWFIDHLAPGSALYNIPVALRIAGPLDAGVLALTLGTIAGRHEALRTVFALRDGAPVQIVTDPFTPALPVIDLADLSDRSDRSDLRDRQASSLIREEAGRPFDLRTGPLLRLGLLRLAADEHILLLTLHHIASDGWSMGVLVHEVTALYAAFAEGRPSPLPELAVQYGDFAAWQRSWLQGAVLDGEIAYWRRQLAGLPPTLELPTDRPRPAVQSFRGASRPVRLPGALTRQVEALGRREGATLFMVLLAGFQVLLARTSGQQDLAVGSPVAGRNRVETEGLIGFFVNTLVLRGDLTGDPTFRELLRRVRETALDAYSHQDVPFEKLVQELAPQRNLAHAPLFQVVLTLQNTPARPLELPGLAVDLLAVETGTAKFDLTLTLQEDDGMLAGSLEHNAGLFDVATMERLLDRLLRLTAAAAMDPDLRLSALPLLSSQERHQLLVEGRGRESAGPRVAGLHHLFEQQVERRPDATALVCQGQSMTYRDLDRAANRLARLLIDREVGAEVRVGLCLERSLEMVVAILAVLKAGGAYVPLDPALPSERLLFQLEDAGVAALVTQTACRAQVSAWMGPLLCLDDLDELDELDEISPAPCGWTDGDGLAYILYTSGSTGRPKGVAVTHSNVIRLLNVTREPFSFGPQDTWTLFHSYAFDFSVWELWGALAHGGRVVVLPRDVARSPDDFFRLLSAERVTVLNQTPSAFRQLAPVWNAATDEPPVRWIIFGGEALEPASLASWFERPGPLPRLVNMYGITETTVHVTLRPVRAEDAGGAARSLIGGPLADLELYVADRGLNPLPLGVPGELCVGGEGLARGYWRRPELTAERFVPDPWSARPGARLYRSGDLGRRLPDGDVESLGRIDHQVKIRGLRIELGEIEAALLALPGVRETVVVVRSDGSVGSRGDRRLVAYVVGDAATGTLRAALRERLPEHMVPASFVLMDTLPLTANGKVDRAALPSPEGSRPELEVSFVAPRTAEERAVAAAWQEVLGVATVGVYDNFFDLGGHSLLMVRVQSHLRDAFAREVPVLDLFQHPTVGALAWHLSAGSAGTEETVGAASFVASESRGESRRARADERQLQRQRRRTGRTGDFES